MPLEIFTNPDAAPNIKGFSIEAAEPKFEPHFDPKREFPDELWDACAKEILTEKVKDDRGDSVWWAAQMAILDNNRARLIFPEDDLVATINRLDVYFKFGDLKKFIATAAQVNTIDQTKPVTIAQADWPAIENYFKELNRNDIEAYSCQVSYLALLNHERAKAFITEADWRRIPEEFDLYRRNGLWALFSRFAAELVRVDRDRALAFVSDDDWRHMRERYENALGSAKDDKEEEKINCAYIAASLTSVSRAEEQAFREKLAKADDVPLPEVRKF